MSVAPAESPRRAGVESPQHVLSPLIFGQGPRNIFVVRGVPGYPEFNPNRGSAGGQFNDFVYKTNPFDWLGRLYREMTIVSVRTRPTPPFDQFDETHRESFGLTGLPGDPLANNQSSNDGVFQGFPPGLPTDPNHWNFSETSITNKTDDSSISIDTLVDLAAAYKSVHDVVMRPGSQTPNPFALQTLAGLVPNTVKYFGFNDAPGVGFIPQSGYDGALKVISSTAQINFGGIVPSLASAVSLAMYSDSIIGGFDNAIQGIVVGMGQVLSKGAYTLTTYIAMRSESTALPSVLDTATPVVHGFFEGWLTIPVPSPDNLPENLYGPGPGLASWPMGRLTVFTQS